MNYVPPAQREAYVGQARPGEMFQGQPQAQVGVQGGLGGAMEGEYGAYMRGAGRGGAVADPFRSSRPAMGPRSLPGNNMGGNRGFDYGGGRGGMYGGGGFGGQPMDGARYHREEKNEDDIFKEHTPGIKFDEYEAIEVSITPNDVQPVESFAAMNLSPLLIENITRCRYTKPTPVQRYGIPAVLHGRDLMACAQTGSGKTAAYLIPAVNHMLMNVGNRPPGGYSRRALPSALVLAPTRELSIQIHEEGRKFTFRTGVRCVVVYGGADPRYQIQELTRGCGLLVATPGRLWDVFTRGYVGFSEVRYLVLDEADRMLDMGFEPQIRKIVQGNETDMPRPGERQTLLYSATFPREIQQLAREFLSRHAFLQVGRVGSTTENITQDVRWVEDWGKRDALIQIIRENEGKLVLVFVEKKRDADYLDRFLHNCSVRCTSIHGDRGQREREEALAMFKNGSCRILVATDVASRGLDIPDVSIVLQYDLPTNIDDYVHRIGRTGRAGKTGLAISFFNEKNRNIVDELIPLLRETNQNVPPEVQALAKKPNMNSHHGHRSGYSRGRSGHNSNPFGNNYGGFNRHGGYNNNNNNNNYGGPGNFRNAGPTDGYYGGNAMDGGYRGGMGRGGYGGQSHFNPNMNPMGMGGGMGGGEVPTISIGRGGGVGMGGYAPGVNPRS